jgi:UDP-N-acetylmuramoyl-tripeptide--D-alanyl-D-alanine ligase
MSTAQIVLDIVFVVALVCAFSAQMLRWLRVLQREHYEPSSMHRFLGRWSSPQVSSAKVANRSKATRPVTLSHVLVVALLVTVLLRADPAAAVVTIAYGILCPRGLSIKGRTSALQWTRRLTMIAVLATLVALIIATVGAFTVRPWLLALAMVWAVPLLLDLSARALAPYERRQAQGFVDQAVARLKRVSPRIVAITGSYGKTSTKNHLADLLGGADGIVASPRSFNNRAGLSRAINENLADGTRVFIAEMGTYGPGEIADLCSWCPPEIAVVTAIGPVHLERMKSLDVIEKAKFEITDKASTVVVNIDDVRLARWPERLRTSGKRVRTAGSTNAEASVRVIEDHGEWTVLIDGTEVARLTSLRGVQPTNVACAVATALELGVGEGEIADRLARVTIVANRSNVVTATSGVVVIDDTFNANPASAAGALSLLKSLPLSGRRVVVTPGLIELGADQYGENLALARKVAAYGAELVIVGRTNARALRAGYEQAALRFDTRDQAVTWVRSALITGDGVLYLNDLPDHYP